MHTGRPRPQTPLGDAPFDAPEPGIPAPNRSDPNIPASSRPDQSRPDPNTPDRYCPEPGQLDIDQPVPNIPAPDAPASDHPAHDVDGLDVAWQTMERLTGAQPRRRPPSPSRHKKPDDRAARADGDLTPVAGALDAFVDERGWRTQVGLRMLLASWPDLVGAPNAEHCHPEGLHDGVLDVRADSTAWASAMRFVAPQLVARLNERLGQGTVTRVAVSAPSGPSWKHGPLSVRDGRGPRDTYG